MEEPNKDEFFQSFFLIEFIESRLEVFKVKRRVLYFFLQKLRVMFESAPSCLDESSRIIEILLKKSFEINLG